MATNSDATWEVVDGVQRLSALVHFCGDDDALKRLNRDKPLMLSEFKEADVIQWLFIQISDTLRLNFTLRPMRVTTLNDKSDLLVRYDLLSR